MKTKFEYGELYDIAPTYGIDIVDGKIQVMGIMHFQCLPDWLHSESWETGNADHDWDLHTKPWYSFIYLEDEEESVFILPEFALEEVNRKAKNKIKIG